LRFGLTSAILDLKSRVEKRPAYQFWDSQNTGDDVLVNALLTRQDDPETNKGFLTTHNFRVVKIKVGSADIGSEIKRVKDLSSVLTDKVSIRLDANRSWNYQQAVQFLDGINGLPVEYIEEPLIDLDELGRLISEQNCPVAIDESLPAWQDRENIPAGLVAIVIKPAVIGSIDENMQWINYARQRNIKAVISDTFHSGIGMIMHINLAVYAGGNHTAMGLDTYRWLEHDLLTTPLPLPSGILATRALLAKNVSPEFTSIKKVF
jgi:O-succinylbenzoate synthase